MHIIKGGIDEYIIEFLALGRLYYYIISGYKMMFLIVDTDKNVSENKIPGVSIIAPMKNLLACMPLRFITYFVFIIVQNRKMER